MAEQSIQDVVKEAQSVGEPSPTDGTAKPSNLSSAVAGEALPHSSTAESRNLSPSKLILSDATLPDAQVSANNILPGVSGVAQYARSESGDELIPGQVEIAENSLSRSESPKDHLVNGTGSGHLTPDDVVHQLLADASGGSDTDTSKGDALDSGRETASRHLRTNSVKKPASFKSVSVTKAFLAKTATATPVAKPGDKGTF